MPLPPKPSTNKNANRPLPKPPGGTPPPPPPKKMAPGTPPPPPPRTAAGGSTAAKAGSASPTTKGGAAANAGAAKVPASAAVSRGPATPTSAGGAAAAPGKPKTGGGMSPSLKPPTKPDLKANANRPLPTPPPSKQTPPQGKGFDPMKKLVPQDKATKPPKTKPEPEPEPSTYDGSREKEPGFKQWQEAAKHADKNLKKYAIKPEELR